MLLDDTESWIIIKYERIIKRKAKKADVLYAMDLSTDRMRRQRGLEEKLSREGLEKERGAFVAMDQERDYCEFSFTAISS